MIRLANTELEQLAGNRNTQPLWDRFTETRSNADRNALVCHYYHLIHGIAAALSRTMPRSVCIEDLESAGATGLIQAVCAYKPEAGTRFETFGQHRIRGAMLDDIRSRDWVSRGRRTWTKKYNGMVGALTNDLGRAPTEEEVADRMSVSPRQYKKLMLTTHCPGISSLDDQMSLGKSEDQTGSFNFMNRAQSNSETAIDSSDLKDFVFKHLSGTERSVFVMYYFEEKKMKEIADLIGVTESRLSQRLTATRAKLQALALGTRGMSRAA